MKNHWALWVSGWPGAQIYFDTAYAALVCLLLAALLGLAWHWNIRLRAAVPAVLLTAALAIGAGNAFSRDVVRVELVGSKMAPAVILSQNDRAVVLYRGGQEKTLLSFRPAAAWKSSRSPSAFPLSCSIRSRPVIRPETVMVSPKKQLSTG